MLLTCPFPLVLLSCSHSLSCIVLNLSRICHTGSIFSPSPSTTASFILLLLFSAPPSPPQQLLFPADITPPPTYKYTLSLRLSPSTVSALDQQNQSIPIFLVPLLSDKHQCSYLHASLLFLPVCEKLRCSSPSCIPCPPLVKGLWHYMVGRAPFCRTASFQGRHGIAKAGRSLLELHSECVCLCVSA